MTICLEKKLEEPVTGNICMMLLSTRSLVFGKVMSKNTVRFSSVSPRKILFEVINNIRPLAIQLPLINAPKTL